MKITSLKPGQIVWSIRRHKMGNTTMRTISVYSVLIIEVDVDGKTVLASWNMNPPRQYRERDVAKWRLKKPLTVRSVCGAERLATRDEIKAAMTETGAAR